MLIGELSGQSGLSRDTIRFYEKQGLIKVSRKQRRANNYKEYPAVILHQLETIKSLKSYGFTLSEIRETMQSWEAGTFDCKEKKVQTFNKITAIEEQIRQLILVRESLLKSIEHCPDHCDILNILQRKV